MRPKAYSYLRFSTPEQAKGDSERRQKDAAARYAEQHGLELDTSNDFADPGVSGFRGANSRKGALRAFLRAVEDGDVPAGSFLLVEDLDRITRQNAWEAFPLFQQIVTAGITLVTLRNGKAYDRETIKEQPFLMFEPLFAMINAHDESAKKAGRVHAAWETKRKAAHARPMTAICPAWLTLDKAAGRFVVNEERAAVVRRMFDMAARGVGLHGIAQAFNAEGVPTWGSALHPKRKPARLWSRGLISFVLENPATVGTLRQHVTEHADGRRVRRPVGTSGKSARRAGPVTAMGRSVPCLQKGAVAVAPLMIICDSPAATAVSAAAPPR